MKTREKIIGILLILFVDILFCIVIAYLIKTDFANVFLLANFFSLMLIMYNKRKK